MLYLIALLLATTIVLLMMLLKKIKRIDNNTWDLQVWMKRWVKNELENEFQQVEALLSLTKELNLDCGLQRTRSWAGSPDFLLVLLRKVRTNRPQIIVECSSGISTIVSARGLQLNGSGHVYSLEHEPEYAEKTRTELARHGLQDWATVLDAPLVDLETRLGRKRWYDISNLPSAPIDLVVVDGPPETTNQLARYPAGPVLIPRLSDNGELMLDDMIRKSEQDAIVAWKQEFEGISVVDIPAEKGIAVVNRKVPATR